MSRLLALLPHDGQPEKEVSFCSSPCLSWYRFEALRRKAEPREAAGCLKATESYARSFMRSFSESLECILAKRLSSLVHSTNSLSLLLEESSISLRSSVITHGFNLSNSLSSVSNNLTTCSGFGS